MASPMDSSTHPALQRVYNLDRSSPSFSHRLSYALDGQDYNQCVLELEDEESMRLAVYLDGVLNTLNTPCDASWKCLRELASLCSAREILPESYTLSNRTLNIDPNPFAVGDRGEVFRGTLNGSVVSVKCMRAYQNKSKKPSQIFYNEAIVWNNLTHPNILTLLGVVVAPTQYMFVSDLISGGPLWKHFRKPDADRFQLLSDVLRGLHYLHSLDVIHGQINGSNILVDGLGHALITGFSKAIVGDQCHGRNDLEEAEHNVQWTAPEVLREGIATKKSDIFSFAMLVIEVFSGAIPFVGRPYPTAILDIIQGRRPLQPHHPDFTGSLWKLVQRCWNQEPSLRPGAIETLEGLLVCDPPVWKRLIIHKPPMEECIPLLENIFSHHCEVDEFEFLSRDNAQVFINIVDGALDRLNVLPPQIYVRCLRTLYRICGHQTLLPESLQIPLSYDITGIPQSSGAFGDIWRGRHLGQEVAAKTLKVFLVSDFEKIRKMFCREVMLWRVLHHPNVLPLLGVTMTENRFVMVSEWMKNGNIVEYLERNPHGDRPELLRNIAEGLIYMHDQRIIHGDLKGANIIINNSGHACLADFSLVRLIPEPSTFMSTCIGGGTFGWMSPELINPQSFGLEEAMPTRESDYYALGMLIYEVLGGKVPNMKHSHFVSLVKIVDGERPKRPEGEEGKHFSDELWCIIGKCWEHNPRDRAHVREVLRSLGGVPPPEPSPDMSINEE